MSAIMLNILGAPTVSYAGQRLTFRNRKALALLIYLALEPGCHSRDRLSALFWPDVDQAHSRMLLRGAIAWLRRALAAAGADPAHVLIVEQDRLRLDSAALDLDLAAIERADTDALTPIRDERPDTRHAMHATLTAVVNAYHGDFLQGFSIADAPLFDEWVSIQREHCHRQMHQIFDRLTQLLCADGEWREAIDIATRWVAHDPLHETAHQRLMQAHAAVGDRAAALQVYQRCRALLEAELGLAPSAETAALAEDIRAQQLSIEQAAWSNKQGFARPFSIAQRAPDSQCSIAPPQRIHEHKALTNAYGAMLQGQVQILVVEDGTNRGDTDLATELAAWATAQGADVLYGRAYDLGGRVAYQPLVDALRQRLDQERAPDDLLPDVWLTELSRLLPDLRDRYPDLPLPLADEATGPMRLYEAVVQLTIALARRRPLVWMVDDIHGADRASLDLLHYAVRRWAASGVPVLLLCTVRSEALRTARRGEQAIADWLAPLARDLSVTCLAQRVPMMDVRRPRHQAIAA